MRAELHAFFTNFAQRAQAENLKTAAIRKNGAGPGGKLVQPPAPVHKLVAGAQIKVIGIAQNNGRANGGQIIGCKRLNRTHGSHGHKDRRGNSAMSRAQHARAGRSVGMFYGKYGLGHAAQIIRKRRPAQEGPQSCTPRQPAANCCAFGAMLLRLRPFIVV